ncbi:hypothetical protein HK101_008594 [Irineochytrium annulatum]|nr:hypothetical protein HK101_008594 [Irineochytrium annulatum]
MLVVTHHAIASGDVQVFADRLLGQGGFGDVYLGKYGNGEVAVKVPRLASGYTKAELDGFHKEIAIFASLRAHTNVVTFYGYVEETNAIVMELSEIGSLKDFYRTNEVRPFTERLSLALDIAEGMAFLHSARPKPIIHRDLKGANVLLVLRGGRLLAKVTDFGLAVVKDSSASKARTKVDIAGTQLYIDPASYYEPIKRDARCDVYAYAVVLTELASWEGPYGFSEDDFPWSWFQCSVMGADHRLHRPVLDNMPADVPVAFISLIKACWDPERVKRPLFAGGAINIDIVEQHFQLGMQYLSEKKYVRARRAWKDAAANKHPEACYQLYLLYGLQVLTFLEADEAVGFLRSAANTGHAAATIELGRLLLKGELVKRDVPEALELLTMAAEDGDKDAMVVLAGHWLEEGCKCAAEKEYRKAAALFRQSSDAGNIDAKVSLANLYEEGNGVPRDHAAAAKLFAEAAEAGSPAAILKTGHFDDLGQPLLSSGSTPSVSNNRSSQHTLDDEYYDPAKHQAELDAKEKEALAAKSEAEARREVLKLERMRVLMENQKLTWERERMVAELANLSRAAQDNKRPFFPWWKRKNPSATGAISPTARISSLAKEALIVDLLQSFDDGGCVAREVSSSMAHDGGSKVGEEGTVPVICLAGGRAQCFLVHDALHHWVKRHVIKRPRTLPNMEVVRITHADLVSGSVDLSDRIAQGFGNDPDCLGVILITDLPDYPAKRARLLPLASKFAALPEDVKNECVHVESSYSFGWSHGKEIMEGEPDHGKGSFYNNPVKDVVGMGEEYKKNHPSYGYDNVWPSSLPELREAYMDLGSYIVNVGLALATHCDKYVAKMSGVSQDAVGIRKAIEGSITHKARLLHYFAGEDESEEVKAGRKMGSWCGLHIDHSMLTGLTSAMFTDDRDPTHAELDASTLPTQTSGLYIKTRGDVYQKISVPRDALAFQIGEASQVASGGLLVATPHLVKGGASKHVARNTFAVFLQPDVDHKLREGMTFDELTKEVMKRHYA